MSGGAVMIALLMYPVKQLSCHSLLLVCECEADRVTVIMPAWRSEFPSAGPGGSVYMQVN